MPACRGLHSSRSQQVRCPSLMQNNPNHAAGSKMWCTVQPPDSTIYLFVDWELTVQQWLHYVGICNHLLVRHWSDAYITSLDSFIIQVYWIGRDDCSWCFIFLRSLHNLIKWNHKWDGQIVGRKGWKLSETWMQWAAGGLANSLLELLWKCWLSQHKQEAAGPLSLMHCFLTRRFLSQIIGLKKMESSNYIELQKNCEWLWFGFFFTFMSLFPCLFLAQLILSPLWAPSPLVSSSRSLSLPAFVPTSPSQFSLLSPPCLCPQALAADCVVWRLNEATLIQ